MAVSLQEQLQKLPPFSASFSHFRSSARRFLHHNFKISEQDSLGPPQSLRWSKRPRSVWYYHSLVLCFTTSQKQPQQSAPVSSDEKAARSPAVGVPVGRSRYPFVPSKQCRLNFPSCILAKPKTSS